MQLLFLRYVLPLDVGYSTKLKVSKVKCSIIYNLQFTTLNYHIPEHTHAYHIEKLKIAFCIGFFH